MPTQLRALEIIDFLASSEGAPTLKEVAEALDLNRASAFRLLEAMIAEGWVTGTGRPRRYEVGLRVLGVGLRIHHYREIREKLFPYVVKATEETGAYGALAFYQEGRVLVTDSTERLAGRVNVLIGGAEYPAPCTAAGKVLLAFATDEEVERVCGAGMPKFTANTRAEPDDIRSEISSARERGYGVADREYFPSSSGIAFPVFDQDSQAVAAIGLAKNGELTSAWLEEVRDPLHRLALQASFEMGYRPASTRALVS